MRFLTVLLLSCMASSAAFAQEQSKYAACAAIPSANNVIYQPGVDVNGNPVVPAALETNNNLGNVLNVVKVPLEFNLAQRIAGLNLDDAQLGMVEIHQDGKIMYQGQDITKPVMTLCGKSYKEVTVDIVDAPIETPQAPIKTEFNEAAAIPNELAVDSAEEAAQLPAVSAPTVEETVAPEIVTAPEMKFVDEISPLKERMENMDRPAVSAPATPKLPLVGIPKGAATETIKTKDLLKGEDHRDYNE